jgi:hypothetical protein
MMKSGRQTELKAFLSFRSDVLSDKKQQFDAFDIPSAGMSQQKSIMRKRNCDRFAFRFANIMKRSGFLTGMHLRPRSNATIK